MRNNEESKQASLINNLASDIELALRARNESLIGAISPIKLSLTQFIKFAYLPPHKQQTKVNEIIRENIEGNIGHMNCYTLLKQGICRYCENNSVMSSMMIKETLNQALSKSSDKGNVKVCVESFLEWLGSKKYETFRVDKSQVCEFDRLNVRGLVDIGLARKGIKYVVKMYFNKDHEPNKDFRMNMALELMRLTIQDESITPVLFDVRRKSWKIHNPKLKLDYEAILYGQARLLAYYYDRQR